MSYLDLFTDKGPEKTWDNMTWEEIDRVSSIQHVPLDTLNAIAAETPDQDKLFSEMWIKPTKGKPPCWAVQHYAKYVRHDEPTICIKHFTVDELKDLIEFKCKQHDAILIKLYGHGYESSNEVTFKLRKGTEQMRFTVKVLRWANGKKLSREEFLRAVQRS